MKKTGNIAVFLTNFSAGGIFNRRNAGYFRAYPTTFCSPKRRNTCKVEKQSAKYAVGRLLCCIEIAIRLEDMPVLIRSSLGTMRQDGSA